MASSMFLQARLVVAGDEQLELRPVGEEVLAHEPGRDRVAAGQRLDLSLGPAPALLGLLRRDQPGAAQHRHVGRVAIGMGGGEAVHRGDGGVVAKDRGDRVQEHALAVAAGAVREEERVLADRSGQAIADRALQIGLELGVPAGDLAEEPHPERAGRHPGRMPDRRP